MARKERKGAEAKIYPNTTLAIQRVLWAAKHKHDTMGASSFLSAATAAHLNTLEPLFRQSSAQKGSAKAKFADYIDDKKKARVSLKLHVSHFIQVFNFGVLRGKYGAEERAIFKLPVEAAAVPLLQGDGTIRTAAEMIIYGEASRIAAGKPAVTNPSLAEVEAAYNLFVGFTQQGSTANDALGNRQKTLRQLHKEARALIKDIWAEVEFHYRKGTRESMRRKAREWGVVYERKGGEKKVTGTATDAATGQPLAVVKLKFKKGRNKTFSHNDGRFSLYTNLLQSQTLLAEREGYEPAEVTVDLKEGAENFCEVKMIKKQV